MTLEAKERLSALLSALDKQIADIWGSAPMPARIMQNIVREVRKLVQL